MKMIYGIVLLALLGDVLHRVSHAPWRCDETCRWYQLLPEREQKL